MKATEILKSEHRLIERVLAVLERAVARMQAGETVRPGLFLDAADFIRQFADGSHHHKEEDVLFQVLIEAGMPMQGGPIAVMLAEHEQARAYTRALREAAERWTQGEEQAKTQVANAARGYAALLRQHIMKEDQVLFPMADRAVPHDEHDKLVTAFLRVEPEAERASVHAKYTALTDALEREVSG